MANKAREAFEAAKDLAEKVELMVGEAEDLDLQRLLKQIEADLMDVQHKLSIAVRLSAER